MICLTQNLALKVLVKIVKTLSSNNSKNIGYEFLFKLTVYYFNKLSIKNEIALCKILDIPLHCNI